MHYLTQTLETCEIRTVESFSEIAIEMERIATEGGNLIELEQLCFRVWRINGVLW